MSMQIKPADRVHFVGDSITLQSWFGPGVGTVQDLMNKLLGKQFPGIPSGSGTVVQTGTPATNGNVVVTATSVVASASGVAGNVVADIAADVPGRITSFTPDVLFIEVGVNDVIGGTSDGSFTSSYTSIITACKAFNPAMRIAVVSILADGELWTSGGGGPWGSNALDAGIATKNGLIAALAGVTYMNVRTPAGAYEVIYNTPEPGSASGILTTDGIHPTTAGKLLMGKACMTNITL